MIAHPDAEPTAQPITAPAPAPSPVIEPVLAAAPSLAPVVAWATVSPAAVNVPPAMLDAAREIADEHHKTTGQPITLPQLKTRLGVGLPMATAAHAALSV